MVQIVRLFLYHLVNFILGLSPELTEFSGQGSRQSADRAGWMWAFVAAGLQCFG